MSASLSAPPPVKTTTVRAKRIKRPNIQQKLRTLDKEASENLFLRTLPEPEVLFSAEHEEVLLTELPQESHEKSILNSYIDDFFFEAPKVVNYDEQALPFLNQNFGTASEDEFITVQEENAQMIRALESLKNEVAIPSLTN